jgi:hypothetical protein
MLHWKLANAELTELASEAGVLDAAKWQARIRDDHSINEEKARLDFSDELIPLGFVSRPCGCAEAESRSVGNSDGVVEVLCLEHRCNGPEQLFVGGGRSWRNVGENCRLVEKTVPRDSLSSGKHFGAGGNRSLYLVVQIVTDRGCSQRTELGLLVARISDADLRNAGDEFVDKSIVNRLMNDEPLRRDAGLTVVDHSRRYRRRYGGVEIGARHDDERIAAPELDDGFLQVLPAALATDRPAPSLPVSVTAATRGSAMIASTLSEPMRRV